MQNFATAKFRENETLMKISGFTVTVMANVWAATHVSDPSSS